MGFFKGLFSDLQDLSRPWDYSLGEWKDKVNNSQVGSPIHGLRAGTEATKLGSAYRLKQGVGRINDGQNPFSSQFIKGTANDQGNNVADWGKQNWPVALGFLGSWAGAGAGGGAAGTGGSEVAAPVAGDTGLGAAMDGLAAGGGGGAIGGAAAGGGAASTLPEITVTASPYASAGNAATIGGLGAAGGAAASSGSSGNSWQDQVNKYKNMMPQQNQQQQQQQPNDIYRDWTLSPQETYQQALAMALSRRRQ